MIKQNRDFLGTGPMVTNIRKYGCNFLCYLWMTGHEDWTPDEAISIYAQAVNSEVMRVNCYVNSGSDLLDIAYKLKPVKQKALYTVKNSDCFIARFGAAGGTAHYMAGHLDDSNNIIIDYNPYEGNILGLQGIQAKRIWKRAIPM